MSNTDAPRNRKEKRAAARENNKPGQPFPRQEIPLAQPDRSGPKGKTLFELAEERQELLAQGQPFDKKHDDGQARDEQGSLLDSPVGPVGDAVLLTLTLSMLHFTLDVLVYSQYRQDIEWRPICVRTATMVPLLFTVIYMLRSDMALRFPVARQVFYLGIAIAAGCYMIFAGNTYDYYAVMKRAPPLGTLWIWSVIEMRLPYALLSVVIDLGYMWFNGFSVF